MKFLDTVMVKTMKETLPDVIIAYIYMSLTYQVLYFLNPLYYNWFVWLPAKVVKNLRQCRFIDFFINWQLLNYLRITQLRKIDISRNDTFISYFEFNA